MHAVFYGFIFALEPDISGSLIATNILVVQARISYHTLTIVAPFPIARCAFFVVVHVLTVDTFAYKFTNWHITFFLKEPSAQRFALAAAFFRPLHAVVRQATPLICHCKSNSWKCT